MEKQITKTYYDNGALKEEYTLVDGVKEGCYKHYYSNGRPYITCNYVHGKKQGLYREYYSSGYLHIECNYYKDKEDELYQRFYELTMGLKTPGWYQISMNPQKMIETNFKAGLINGVVKVWYEYDKLPAKYPKSFVLPMNEKEGHHSHIAWGPFKEVTFNENQQPPDFTKYFTSLRQSSVLPPP